MTFKKTTLFIHRWLGLISGLVVLIVGLTGCILAFREEVEAYTKPYLFAKVKSAPLLLPSAVEDQVKHLPGIIPDSIMLSSLQYPGPGHALIVNYHIGKKQSGQAYLDPYTGKALKFGKPGFDFFEFAEHGHRWLWFPFTIGRSIQSSFILAFFVLLISGIILWWPKRWTTRERRQSFTIETQKGTKRLNYDLHNVLGFYMSLVALIIVITGLCISLPWFQGGIYWLTSGGKAAKPFKPALSDTTIVNPTPLTTLRVDSLFRLHQHRYASAYYIWPATKKAALLVLLNTDPEKDYKREFRYYDQYTLRDISAQSSFYGTYDGSGMADKLRRMNVSIHMGTIGGVTTKIIAFLASLIAASLPVTGFIIWWGKRKKKKKSNNKKLIIKP